MMIKCLSIIALIFIFFGAAADEGDSAEMNVSLNGLNETAFDSAYNATNPEYRASDSPFMRRSDLEDWRPIVPPEPREVEDMVDPTAVEIYDISTKDVAVIPSDNVTQQADETGLNATPPFEGMPSPVLSPTTVFPPDDRVRITDTTVYPWRTICKLLITMPDTTQWMGSGALIGCQDGHGYHVLTAGHCVYDPDHGGWASSIEVIPGLDDNYMPYFSAWSTYMRSYTGWTQYQDHQHDWAVITLDRNIGDYTGWMGRMTAAYTDAMYTGVLNTAGYPGDKGGWTMWYDSNNGRTANEYNHWYYMDTYEGQSGSPVWRFVDSDRYILTVHTHGDDGSASNHGTRLNQDKFDRVITWCGEDLPPTDKADLIDDGQTWSGFTPGTIIPGQTFNVWSDVRNVGTAASGGFYVSYYASTNNIISTGDYLIGDDYVPSIAPFAYGDSDWSGAFPSIPAGTYYVGWIIDRYNQVTEFDKTNNVAYKDSYQLVVNPPASSDFIGVFRPSAGTFFLDYQNNGWTSGDAVIPFGMSGDLPVAGDVDNDGIDEIGVFRPTAGTFFLDYQNNGWTSGDAVIPFGMSGDLPVAGDWDNDGIDEIGVFRPAAGTFFLDYQNNGWTSGDAVIPFGMSGDLPVAGDWDNDGIDEIGVFRPSAGTFFLDYQNNGWTSGDAAIPFGMSGDLPVAGDWDNDGIDEIGVFRPSAGTFFLDYQNNGWTSGDAVIPFGMSGDLPVAGAWI